MVTRVIPSADVLVDTDVREAVDEVGTEEEMIEPQARVPSISVPKVIPKRVNAFFWKKVPERVCPSLIDQLSIGVSDLGAEKRVINPPLRLIDV
jgi:hypothetical protein